MIADAARVLIPSVTAFMIGIALAPVLTHYLYKFRVWKKRGGKGNGLGDASGTPIFDSLHAERETRTPRMGGILIWSSVLVTAGVIGLLSVFAGSFYAELNFVNRSQTWLPFAALVFGALIGLINDILDVVTPDARGLSLRVRLGVITVAATGAAWWFYAKLGVSAVGVPFSEPLHLGLWFIPFFVLVVLALYASGIIDGIDGLSGGVFSIIFMTYAGIAFVQHQVSLAAFAATVAGATLAFLWFNIPPARFWMTETGSMALTLALAITAFSADVLGDGVGVAVLPIIAFPLLATVVTTLMQVFSKKVLKRKIFRVAPIHHHFEAIGWPATKVVMRYWVITLIAGVLGLAVALVA